MSSRQLGRIQGIPHPNLVRMGAILGAQSSSLPPLPDRQDWYSSVASWPMLGNNTWPNCTIAAAGHMIQQESVYAGVEELLMTDDEAARDFRAVVPGFDPNNPATFNTGAYEGDVGLHWLRQGFQVGGALDKIAGFANVATADDLEEMKYAILLTGNALLGINLPKAIANGDNPQGLWDVPASADGAEIEGGHAIPAVGYDADGLWIISWAELNLMTWAFYRKYILEGHATLSRRWMNAKGTTPAGFSWDALVTASQRTATIYQ